MKDKILNFIQDRIGPAVEKFSDNNIVKAMVSGMSAPMAAITIGSFISLLASPPIPANTTSSFLLGIQEWSKANASWLKVANNFTTNMLAIYGLIGVTIAYAQTRKARPTNYVIMSMAAFLIICSGNVEGGIDSTFFGALGLFSSIIIGVAVVALGEFLKKHGLKIKLPDSVPPNIAEPLEAIFISLVIVV